MKPRVLVLHTGGTIGMGASPDGYRPMAGFGEVLARQRYAQAALPAFDVVELDTLIDSANLQPAHWGAIAQALLARWDDYTGFVVLHGTDTMAWSASALSFMLRGADKPVILTGAQIPLVAPRSDAPENLQTALLLAAGYPIREVCVYFSRRLLRGNRASKLKSTAFDAFDSPNWPHLAEVGIDIALNREALLPASARDFVVPAFDAEAVAVLAVYPGISARVVEAVLDSRALRALVLRTYGVGNAPDADPRLMDALARAVGRGIVVVNTTQCASGGVDQGSYATGASLARIGVVPGADMTLEAAFAKLHFLIATGAAPDAARAIIGQSLSGELS
jgi:L-asparaginase